MPHLTCDPIGGAGRLALADSSLWDTFRQSYPLPDSC